MKITKWFSKEENKKAMDGFKARFEEKNLDGKADAVFYFKASSGAIDASQNFDEDDEKYELWENLEYNLEEYESIAYFIEIRDNGPKIVLFLTEDEQKLGLWEGEYTEEEAKVVLPSKNYVWMDWTPACQEKIMGGDPNTDAEFFSGDLTVKGPLKLASMPRELGYDFFEFLEIEI